MKSKLLRTFVTVLVFVAFFVLVFTSLMFSILVAQWVFEAFDSLTAAWVVGIVNYVIDLIVLSLGLGLFLWARNPDNFRRMYPLEVETITATIPVQKVSRD